MRSVVSTLLVVPLLLLTMWSVPSEASVISTTEVFATQLELKGGSVDSNGWFLRKLDRLFDQPGTLVMNEYQAIGDIVPSITKGLWTFSLFTSGFNGAPAPSVEIDGSSISADLSSLYFGQSRGDHFRILNIGGVARGTFDPGTLEFYLTWDHVFGDRHRGEPVTFSLQGKVVEASTAPVPLATTAVFFATGLAMLMGLWRQRGMTINRSLSL